MVECKPLKSPTLKYGLHTRVLGLLRREWAKRVSAPPFFFFFITLKPRVE
jgi:hypothetical protein